MQYEDDKFSGFRFRITESLTYGYRLIDGERVPLGRPIQNAHVYVVDEHLSGPRLGEPVPLARGQRRHDAGHRREVEVIDDWVSMLCPSCADRDAEKYRERQDWDYWHGEGVYAKRAKQGGEG